MGRLRRRSGTTQPRHRAVARKPIADGPKGAASRARARQRSSLQLIFDGRRRALREKKGAQASRLCLAVAWQPHRRGTTRSRGARAPFARGVLSFLLHWARPPSAAPPRPTGRKFHRPSAAFFSIQPARARVGAPEGGRAPRDQGAAAPQAFAPIDKPDQVWFDLQP
jgi:hypothetical protein